MSLSSDLLSSFKDHSGRNALFTGGRFHTYGELAALSEGVARRLLSLGLKGDEPAVIAGKGSFFTYAALCGTVLAGGYYVPLNENFPTERNMSVIKASGARFIIADPDDFTGWENIFAGSDGYEIIVPPSCCKRLAADYPGRRFHGAGADSCRCGLPPDRGEDSVYLLFTSGSTGKPKGIRISRDNLSGYISAFCERNRADENGRLIQMNDLTFDLSAHSVFLSFLKGGCLYVPDRADRINPVSFINRHGINHALLVPSVLTMMRKMRVLKSGAMPSLEYAAFCGEALPFDDARLFSLAAPGAKIENIYGPTEATIACTYFEFGREATEKADYCGSVPIGAPNVGMEAVIVDEAGRPVPDGSVGELALSGRQLAGGYLNDPEQTAGKFVKKGCKTYYMTGDLCKMTDDGIVFLGRNDSQAQIRGYRVELYEVENAISRIDGCLDAVVIPVPVGAVNYSGMTAFVLAKESLSAGEVKERLKNLLPPYMVPDDFIITDDFPVNSNGKVDRNRLKSLLDA